MREVIPLYKSVYNGVKDLDPETFKRLMLSLMEYGFNDDDPELQGLERTVFESWKANIDARFRDSENGKKGGRPIKNPPFENENPGFETENPPLEDENGGIESEKHITKTKTKTETKTKTKESRFTPPSVDEVEAFCRERGNSVNAERFVDFYTSKGWRIGKDPMKDWQAAVRTWEKRDDTRAAPPRHGEQRADDLDARILADIRNRHGG